MHLFLAGLLLLGLLKHLLDDLLLLDQESSDDPVPHAVGASRTTIGTLDSLLRSGGGGIFTGSESRNLFTVDSQNPLLFSSSRSNFPILHSCRQSAVLVWGATYAWEFDAAVTAFRGSSSLLDVQEPELATGSLDDTDVVRGGVVAICHDHSQFPSSIQVKFHSLKAVGATRKRWKARTDSGDGTEV